MVVNTYYPDGKLHYQYRINQFINEPYPLEVVYYIVNDKDGENLIDKAEEFDEHLYDEITQREIVNHFKRNKLLYTYHIKDGKKIYQSVDPRFKVKISKLQTKLKNTDIDFFEKMKEIQGTYLVYIQVKEDGTVSSFRTLNKLEPILDNHIEEFLTQNLSTASLNYQKFNKYKVGKEKISYELVLPININFTVYFSKNFNDNFYFNNLMWQQMHQDHIMNSVNNIQPPPFIR